MASNGSRVNRRTLLRAGGAAALGALAGCPPSTRSLSGCSGPLSRAGATARPASLQRDPAGLLDLPPGFSYRIVQRFGDKLSDGYRMAGRPDAMGAFAAPDGSIVLMRNHELPSGYGELAPYTEEQGPPREAYDPQAPGGVTRLVLDPETLAIRSSNLVLAGTYWNCAGGVSPWGWLSCEETEEPNHGFVFVCRTDAEHVAPPRPIRGYGRFRHEAASIDPKTSIAYLTEDHTDGCFYRFLPARKDTPFEGKLQALRVTGKPSFDTAPLTPGPRLPVDWVDVPDPSAESDAVRAQAQAAGAAVFRRCEGLWLGPDAAYFCATVGGPIGHGQIFRLTLGDQANRGTAPALRGGAANLDVIAASTDPDVLDNPDNLCVSPHGELYVAEDSLGGNFLRRVSLDGKVLPFARNARSTGEFAGPCFSPDGRTLFLNMQVDQVTLAIRGPFDKPLPVAQATRTASLGATGLALLALAAFTSRRLR